MAYRIQKRSTDSWRILLEYYDNKKRRFKVVARADYRSLGIDPKGSIEAAQKTIKTLNSVARVVKVDERKAVIQERIDSEELAQNAVLPPHIVEEFESKVLFTNIGMGDKAHFQRNKLDSHWRATKRITITLIQEAKLEPSDWHENAPSIFALFKEKQFSPSYAQKIVRIMNRWGAFYCKKTGKSFLPIENARGVQRERIADANFEKNPHGLSSAPLTPSLLESKKDNLKIEAYNWLYLSVWLGLRPKEIDGLKDAKNFKIEHQKDILVLWVYQSKLVTIPKDQRWKVLPLLYPEQLKIIEILNKGEFKRPLPKTVRGYFGERVTLYGGRKNFCDMMLDKGQRLEDISQWLGHTQIDRTWRSYKQRTKVNFTKVG